MVCRVLYADSIVTVLMEARADTRQTKTDPEYSLIQQLYPATLAKTWITVVTVSTHTEYGSSVGRTSDGDDPEDRLDMLS